MKNINKYIGVIALGTTILASTSCSDTWDDHVGDKGDATKTLWEQISSNPNLSKFTAIAEASSYYKDETHPLSQNGKNFTFKDMLSGTQLLTVWAPENDAISDTDYDNWLELAKTHGYTVQQQFLGNSMALWRNVATGGGVDTLRMLNGKKLAFDKNNFTMAGIPMEEKNLAAKNGTLHTVGKTLPFNYNIYEYLKDASNASKNNVGKFHDYIIDNDTTYFSDAMSIEGNPDENGNPTYVDSAYMTTNTMFMGTKRFPSQTNTDKYLTYQESFGANIESEDSSFVLIMPTDEAWNNAYSKLEKYYNYASIYVDNDKVNSGSTNVYRQMGDATAIDSIKNQSIYNDIISPLCYNVNIQPNAAGRKGVWTAENFVQDRGNSAEYLLNTFGDTLRTDENWDKSEMLQGTPIQMSNGYGIITNSWNVPAKLYKPNLIVEVGYQSFYNTSNATGTAESKAFSCSTREWSKEYGTVSDDNFYYIYPASATGNPKFEFKLVGTDGENMESEVMSGKYDIYAVLVPNFYMTSNDSCLAYTTGTQGSGYITEDGDTIPVKHKLYVTLSYCNNNANGKDATITNDKWDSSLKTIEYDGTSVQKLLLFKDFEFPYSYKNLRFSYPTLTITTKTSSSDRKNGYSNDFCIDRILLISSDTE